MVGPALAFGALPVLGGAGSASTEDGFSMPFALAAGIAALVWLGVIGLVVLARRPPRVHAGPDTQDLPDEAPAVAGLLCDDFTPGPEAGPATLVDLAARRQLTIDEVQPGRTLLRMRRGGSAEGLAPFERRVFDEVSERALDGVVPADALTTGEGKASKGWHRDLAKEVVDESQRRGLTVNRWSRPLLTLVGGFAVVPIALLFIASEVGGDPDNYGALAAFIVAVLLLVAGFAIIAALLRSLAQLPTPAGREAAARALGLRDHLRQSPTFPDAPPASVQLWGRHLAYAAAMGIAQATVETLPFGEEDDNWAWSRFGERWRRVHVRYPRAIPPGWGKHPAFAGFLAVLWGGVAIFVVYSLSRLARADLDDPTIDKSVTDWIGRGALLATIPFVFVIGWALWVLVRAVPDFWTNRTVVGEIVRARQRQQMFKYGDDPKYWYYLAVDDGTKPRITAWRVRSQIWGPRNQGDTVETVVTPNLGYVRDMEPAESPAGKSSPSVG